MDEVEIINIDDEDEDSASGLRIIIDVTHKKVQMLEKKIDGMKSLNLQLNEMLQKARADRRNYRHANMHLQSKFDQWQLLHVSKTCLEESETKYNLLRDEYNHLINTSEMRYQNCYKEWEDKYNLLIKERSMTRKQPLVVQPLVPKSKDREKKCKCMSAPKSEDEEVWTKERSELELTINMQLEKIRYLENQLNMWMQRADDFKIKFQALHEGKEIDKLKSSYEKKIKLLENQLTLTRKKEDTELGRQLELNLLDKKTTPKKNIIDCELCKTQKAINEKLSKELEAAYMQINGKKVEDVLPTITFEECPAQDKNVDYASDVPSDYISEIFRKMSFSVKCVEPFAPSVCEETSSRLVDIQTSEPTETEIEDPVMLKKVMQLLDAKYGKNFTRLRKRVRVLEKNGKKKDAMLLARNRHLRRLKQGRIRKIKRISKMNSIKRNDHNYMSYPSEDSEYETAPSQITVKRKKLTKRKSSTVKDLVNPAPNVQEIDLNEQNPKSVDSGYVRITSESDCNESNKRKIEADDGPSSKKQKMLDLFGDDLASESIGSRLESRTNDDELLGFKDGCEVSLAQKICKRRSATPVDLANDLMLSDEDSTSHVQLETASGTQKLTCTVIPYKSNLLTKETDSSFVQRAKDLVEKTIAGIKAEKGAKRINVISNEIVHFTSAEMDAMLKKQPHIVVQEPKVILYPIQKHQVPIEHRNRMRETQNLTIIKSLGVTKNIDSNQLNLTGTNSLFNPKQLKMIASLALRSKNAQLTQPNKTRKSQDSSTLSESIVAAKNIDSNLAGTNGLLSPKQLKMIDSPVLSPKNIQLTQPNKPRTSQYLSNQPESLAAVKNIDSNLAGTNGLLSPKQLKMIDLPVLSPKIIQLTQPRTSQDLSNQPESFAAGKNIDSNLAGTNGLLSPKQLKMINSPVLSPTNIQLTQPNKPRTSQDLSNQPESLAAAKNIDSNLAGTNGLLSPKQLKIIDLPVLSPKNIQLTQPNKPRTSQDLSNQPESLAAAKNIDSNLAGTNSLFNPKQLKTIALLALPPNNSHLTQPNKPRKSQNLTSVDSPTVLNSEVTSDATLIIHKNVTKTLQSPVFPNINCKVILTRLQEKQMPLKRPTLPKSPNLKTKTQQLDPIRPKKTKTVESSINSDCEVMSRSPPNMPYTSPSGRQLRKKTRPPESPRRLSERIKNQTSDSVASQNLTELMLGSMFKNWEPEVSSTDSNYVRLPNSKRRKSRCVSEGQLEVVKRTVVIANKVNQRLKRNSVDSSNIHSVCTLEPLKLLKMDCEVRLTRNPETLKAIALYTNCDARRRSSERISAKTKTAIDSPIPKSALKNECEVMSTRNPSTLKSLALEAQKRSAARPDARRDSPIPKSALTNECEVMSARNPSTLKSLKKKTASDSPVPKSALTNECEVMSIRNPSTLKTLAFQAQKRSSERLKAKKTFTDSPVPSAFRNESTRNPTALKTHKRSCERPDARRDSATTKSPAFRNKCEVMSTSTPINESDCRKRKSRCSSNKQLGAETLLFRSSVRFSAIETNKCEVMSLKAAIKSNTKQETSCLSSQQLEARKKAAGIMQFHLTNTDNQKRSFKQPNRTKKSTPLPLPELSNLPPTISEVVSINASPKPIIIKQPNKIKKIPELATNKPLPPPLYKITPKPFKRKRLNRNKKTKVSTTITNPEPSTSKNCDLQDLGSSEELSNLEILSKSEYNDIVDSLCLPDDLENIIDPAMSDEPAHFEIWESPASPTPEILDEWVPLPKHIPLKNTHYLPSATEVGVLKLLLRFPRDLRIEGRVVDYFQTRHPRLITEAVLKMVMQDIYDKLERFQNRRAPLLTITQQVLLSFLFKLDEKGVPDILNIFLNRAEKVIISIKIPKHFEPVARLHEAVCKYRYMSDRMRFMLCQALTFMGNEAIPYWYIVLPQWTELIPCKEDLETYSDHQKLLVRTMIQVIHLKQCKEPDYNLHYLRTFLLQHYEYSFEREDSAKLLEELFESYTNSSAFTDLTAIIMLCKNHDAKFVYDQVNLKLKPILETDNLQKVCFAIQLFGRITKLFYQEHCEDKKIPKIFKQYQNYLKQFCTDSKPECVREAAAASLRILTKI